MSLAITFHMQERLLEWAGRRVATNEWPQPSVALGVIDTELRRIVAVFVINARFGHQCSMHIATDGRRRWATRAVLRELFDYVFHTLRHTRVNALIAVHNIPMIVTALKVGFVVEGTLKAGADDGLDAILLRMLVQECPWIAEREGTRHGQKVGTVA